MDDSLREHIRYLELCLGACRARPELHERQIAAYERHLAMARAVPSIGAFHVEVQTSADAIAIARAEWMDRYANAGRFHAALGDDDQLGAALVDFRAALEAAGALDFACKMGAAKTASEPMRQAAGAARSALPRLVIALLEWVTEGSAAARGERGREIESCWAIMRQSDPACSWARICEYPPYRSRLPFGDEQMRVIGAWLEAALGPAVMDDAARGQGAAGPMAGPMAKPMARIDTSLFAAEDPPAAPRAEPVEPIAGAAVPPVSQVALAYHMTYQAICAAGDVPDLADPALIRLYERIFALEAQAADAHGFLRMLAEDGLLLELVRVPELAAARRGRERARHGSQPHLWHHYLAMEAALEACRTPTEVEHEVARSAEHLAVEASWNEVLLRYAMKAVDAVCGYELDRSDAQRQTVIASQRVVHELFGKDWDQLLAVPRIWAFFCDEIFRATRQLSAEASAEPGAGVGVGVFWGEIGMNAVERGRGAALGHLVERALASGRAEDMDGQAFATAEDMRAHLGARFREATGSASQGVAGRQPPARAATLLLWGTPVSMDELMDIWARSPRPG